MIMLGYNGYGKPAPALKDRAIFDSPVGTLF
jgi:hypothetical protein